jgi:oligoribonuclease (3'-5' exoribonuclease)
VSVQEEVMKYIKKWIPLRRTAMLAGNSVHADRVFLAKEMPEIVDWLHYRSLGYASLHLLLVHCLIILSVPFIIRSIVGKLLRFPSLFSSY